AVAVRGFDEELRRVGGELQDIAGVRVFDAQRAKAGFELHEALESAGFDDDFVGNRVGGEQSRGRGQPNHPRLRCVDDVSYKSCLTTRAATRTATVRGGIALTTTPPAPPTAPSPPSAITTALAPIHAPRPIRTRSNRCGCSCASRPSAASPCSRPPLRS